MTASNSGFRRWLEVLSETITKSPSYRTRPRENIQRLLAVFMGHFSGDHVGEQLSGKAVTVLGEPDCLPVDFNSC